MLGFCLCISNQVSQRITAMLDISAPYDLYPVLPFSASVEGSVRKITVCQKSQVFIVVQNGHTLRQMEKLAVIERVEREMQYHLNMADNGTYFNTVSSGRHS